MRTIRFLLIMFVCLLCGYATELRAQEDLLSALEATESPEVNYALATFKGSRLINGHTVMTRRKGSLEFLIAHRFGRLNTGIYQLFGLDNANVRFGLDYGVTDQLTVGFGRNSFEKTYDGFAKFAVLRQQYGKRNIPISITMFTSVAAKTLKNTNPEIEVTVSDRLAYSFQALIARKFNQAISLQLMPSLVHFNAVAAGEKNDLFSVGMGGRVKITKRMSINLEYYYRIDVPEDSPFQNPLAIGIDLETGGHVFQFQFTNSRSMVEKGFIRETTGRFFEGDVHFGFNITRTF